MKIFTGAKSVTSFTAVTFVVFASLLTACHTGVQSHTLTPTAGLSSPNGQKLVLSAWCTETRLDEANHYVTDHFSFRPDGDLFVTSMQLENDGTLEPIGKSQGTWSITNDQLYMIHGQETLVSVISPKVRASDNVNCFELTASSTSARLCPCTN